MPRRSDSRRGALRELGVRARAVRLRSGAAVRADAPRLHAVGPSGPQRGVMPSISILTIVYWAFAGLAVLAALMCITRRNPLASALWLVQTLFCIAILFTILHAPFIGVLQVLVYAGAIMVLFLFVIMLLNLG